jgi:membrane protease YdiL (CAAX protease family)
LLHLSGNNLPVNQRLGLENCPFLSAEISPFYYATHNCFVLGIVDGKAYQETNSVLYPMIMHSVSNVITVGLGYVFSIIGA